MSTMPTKKQKTRIQNKHETEAVWDTGTTFVPLPGEFIIYDTDADHNYPRVKIGNTAGSYLKDLPFLNEKISDDEIDEICK